MRMAWSAKRFVVASEQRNIDYCRNAECQVLLNQDGEQVAVQLVHGIAVMAQLGGLPWIAGPQHAFDTAAESDCDAAYFSEACLRLVGRYVARLSIAYNFRDMVRQRTHPMRVGNLPAHARSYIFGSSICDISQMSQAKWIAWTTGPRRRTLIQEPLDIRSEPFAQRALLQTEHFE
ncbi:hypothetical protein AAHS21_04135 [Mycobacterium sp. 050272]|uniref:hypothetical protein n=1 Tax=Mycobacterium sp. 050272 TaxID=3142488 RepID=UPI0031857EDF